MTTKDWKKEAAQRGYWYRKIRRKYIEQLEKSISITQSLFTYISLYYNAGLTTGRSQGRDEVQAERDDYREKYWLFIKKFNITRKENEELCEKLEKVIKDSKENEDSHKKHEKENKELHEKLKKGNLRF